jgi:hypothetical protein
MKVAMLLWACAMGWDLAQGLAWPSFGANHGHVPCCGKATMLTSRSPARVSIQKTKLARNFDCNQEAQPTVRAFVFPNRLFASRKRLGASSTNQMDNMKPVKRFLTGLIALAGLASIALTQTALAARA